MGPPPRSLAAEAIDCFMVRVPYGSNRIQGRGAMLYAQWQAPLGLLAQCPDRANARLTLDPGRLAQAQGRQGFKKEEADSLTNKSPYKEL
jgi:hypothetical protein